MTDVNNDKADNSTESGAAALPLRGLAMVLIAVAVLLGLWGLYALTQGDEAAQGSQQAQTSSAAPQTSPTERASSTLSESTPAAEEQQEEGAGEEAGVPAPVDNAPAPLGDTSEVVVNVANNSVVNGLAEDTYYLLERRGYKVGEHGNLPAQDMERPLPETTVFFQPGDATGEAAANELAQDLRSTFGVPVTVAPNSPALAPAMAGEGKITVGLIGQLTESQVQ